MGRIGKSVKRLEDPILLKGQGQFIADINCPNQIYMRVVRSPVAFGKIKYIDTELARNINGVIDIWTGQDLKKIPPIGFRMTVIPGLEPYRQRILSLEWVRYVGEPIAVVFANNQYIAEDAAELVYMEVEEFNPQRSARDVPINFDENNSNHASSFEKKYGDLNNAFIKAENTMKLELKVGRHSGVPLETRGALANYLNHSDEIQLYGAAKVPHFNRSLISEMLNWPINKIHLFEGHVGGGFGVRGELYPEDVLVCKAAMKFKKPVKWIEDRKENLIATNHSRDQFHEIKVAFNNDGYILGFDNEFWCDQGAYIRTHAATVPDLTAAMLPGPYIFPSYRSKANIILTNKTPSGTYRAPGRYEGTFVRERTIDAIALKIKRDPIEVRKINLINKNDFPFDRKIFALGTPVIYDSGDYSGLLEKLLEKINYKQLKAEVLLRKKQGEKVGIGFGYFVEKSGLGPFDDVILSICNDGNIKLITGAASIGQGVETSLAQIISETLGVNYSSVNVIHGQTNQIERGMGAFATRVTVMTGSASYKASLILRKNILNLASEKLQEDPKNLYIEDGIIFSKNNDVRSSISFKELYKLSKDNQDQFTVKTTFETTQMTYPYGMHFAQIKLDKMTANVEIERFLIAYDVGRSINPMLVKGQLVGGAVQGIGGALFEEFLYDENMQPLSTSFVDYLIPTIKEVPEIETLILEKSPSTKNPLGVKGAGEGGITAVGAAIAAAVENAIGKEFCIDQLPISPNIIYEKMFNKN